MNSKPFMTSTMKIKINRDAIVEWRKELEDNHGERARLRRCREPVQVLLNSSYYQLKADLYEWPETQHMALAAAAGLVANADFSGLGYLEISFPAQLGSPKKEGGKPLMSETRFRRLIKSHDWSEFYSRMRRAIHMIKGDANIISIVDFVLQYGYEQRGEFKSEPSQGFQFRFAEDYFEASLKNGKKEAS